MDFNKLNLAELDKDLSEEQRKEWNAIYASYRSGSLLTGRVVGMDTTKITVKNEKTGEYESVAINCLVIIDYRVKVLIPESEVWFDERTKRPDHVLKSMTGAEIDYIITNIDREGECAVASRRQALETKRKALSKRKQKLGEMSCRMLAVGKTHCLVEAGGYDITLSQKDISYGMIADIRELYRPGKEVGCVVKEYDADDSKLLISIKEAEPHPFEGADLRHPVGSRRASKITGKYGGGVFCRLDRNLDCLCTYSPNQHNDDFDIGADVIVVITKYEYNKRQVYGRIVAKW